MAAASWLAVPGAWDSDAAVLGSYLGQWGALEVSLLAGLGLAGCALVERRHVAGILRAWTAGVGVVGAVAIAQRALGYLPQATLSNPDFAGCLLAVAVPVALHLALEARTWPAWLAFAAVGGGVLATRTRTAWIALLAVGALAAWRRAGRAVAAAMVAAALAVATWALTCGDGAGARPGLLVQGLEVVSMAPLAGVGWGNYARAPLAQSEVIADNPHNLYVGTWAQGGLLALAALLWVVWRIVAVPAGASATRRAIAAAGAVYAICGLGSWDTVPNAAGLVVLAVCGAALEERPRVVAARAVLAAIGVAGLLAVPAVLRRYDADRAFLTGDLERAAASGEPYYQLRCGLAMAEDGDLTSARAMIIGIVSRTAEPWNAWGALAVIEERRGNVRGAERARRVALTWLPHFHVLR